MQPEAELAWAAGLWDGEGCTGLMRCRPNALPNIRLSTSQKYRPDCIDRFYEAIGRRGTLSQRTRPDATLVGISYQWRTHKRSLVYETMMLLWPYLSLPKQEQFLEKEAEYYAARGQDRPSNPCLLGRRRGVHF